MKRLRKPFKSRKFYYGLSIFLVLAVNINALVEPVYAKIEYIYSHQQSVIEQYGSWDTLAYKSPVRAVHAALLHTGKVLLIAGSGNDETEFNAKTFRTVIWDPTNGKFTEVPTPWDAFCAGHVFLPDGKLLVAGGTKGYEDLTKTPRVNYSGLKDSYVFNPDTEKYEKVSDMQFARWYPTLVGLGDGRVLAAAGLDEKGKYSNGETEIYDPATKLWTYKPKLRRVFPTYPSLILTTDGRLFYTGSSQGYPPSAGSLVPGLWNLKNNQFNVVKGLPEPRRTDNSASVLLPPAQDQKVMLLGGSKAGDSPVSETTDRTAIVNLSNSKDPSYVRGPSLHNATRYPGVVILPDDTVLETGGSRGYRNFNLHSAEIYHPDTNTLTTAASPRVGRNYHSEAILLPDGRVATFGSNPLDNTFEMRIEIYSPAYMFKGERPVITAGNTEMPRGATVTVKTSRPDDIKSAKLIRPSAVTHVTDVEQRSINLPFTTTSDGIAVTVPTNPNLVPSGWYMEFVTNKQNIPSVAHWVHVP
jgi:hypothetical protein